jgi:dynein heavy chain
VPLFEGICSDLFPGVDLPRQDHDELVSSLKECSAYHNLQATSWFAEKVMQVYDMILIRQGLMIVGLPMGGKTCSYQVHVHIYCSQKWLLARLHLESKYQ